MTIGQLITEARLKRLQELENQLRAMTTGREPETAEQFAEWKDRIQKVEDELRILRAAT